MVCNQSHHDMVHLHGWDLLHKQEGANGVEHTEEVKDCDSDCAAWPLQMLVYPVQQVNNGVIHAKWTWYPRHLQRIQSWGAAESVSHSSSSHATSAPMTCSHWDHWDILSLAPNQCRSLKARFNKCWNNPASCPAPPLGKLGLMLFGPLAKLIWNQGSSCVTWLNVTNGLVVGWEGCKGVLRCERHGKQRAAAGVHRLSQNLL